MATVSKLLLIMYGIFRYHPVSPRNVTRRCEFKWAWYDGMFDFVCMKLLDLLDSAIVWWFTIYFFHVFFKWELLILTLFFPPSLMIITDPIGIAGDGLTFCCRPVGCTNGMLTDQPRASCVSRWQLGPGRSTHRVNILLIENSGCPGLQLSLFLMERTFVIHGFSWFGWIGNDGQLLLHMTRS